MSLDQVTCKICRRQFAKYTCPSCNVSYCSLSCFRSPAHQQCSESFYKREIEKDIRTAPSKTMEERQRMMELLRNFEEENANEDLSNLIAAEPGDEGSLADLAERLNDVNLDDSDPDALWSLLNAEERSRFMKAMENPGSELAQQLLHSEELEKDHQRPWWEDSEIDDGTLMSSKPEPILIPSSMVKPMPSSPSLIYNTCAICIAYAFTIRRFAKASLSSISPADANHEEARQLISQLVPFLTERKSTTHFSSVSEVVMDIWPRFGEGEVSAQTLVALLGDCISLLRPLPVTSIQTESSTSVIDPRFHPHYRPTLVLSDLSELFRSVHVGEKTENAASYHTTQKLLFYAGRTLSTPSHVFQLVSSQLSSAARNIRQELTGWSKRVAEEPNGVSHAQTRPIEL